MHQLLRTHPTCWANLYVAKFQEAESVVVNSPRKCVPNRILCFGPKRAGSGRGHFWYYYRPRSEALLLGGLCCVAVAWRSVSIIARSLEAMLFYKQVKRSLGPGLIFGVLGRS